MGLVPVREMAAHIVHVAHGTAAVRGEKRLNHRRNQRKAEAKASDLFSQTWVQELLSDEGLDGVLKGAA
jgi:hypothetical protein